MPLTLYLIRHGEIEGSAFRKYTGSIDVVLSKNGIEQIKVVSTFFNDILLHKPETIRSKISLDTEKDTQQQAESGLLLDAIYASPLKRALDSAEIIAAPYRIKPFIFKGLREMSFGKWEGMTFDSIKQQYPEAFNAWTNNPFKNRPVGGESIKEVSERVINVLHQVLSRHSSGNIAIVAHGGVNRVILCHLTGIPYEHLFRIEQDYACVNIIEFWESYPVIKALNIRPDFIYNKIKQI